MANADDIRRETEARERSREESQATRNRQTLRDTIGSLLASLHELAHQIFGYREQNKLAEAEQEAWRSLHKDGSRPSETPAYLMSMSAVLLLIYPAVYALDVFLLSGNAKQLVKDFAQGNQVLIYAAILAVPLAILLTETYFQTQWSVATVGGQRWLWGTASVLMCLAMPAIIVGFSMSTSVNNGGARTAQVQNWHLVGKAAMALFAHAAVLLGGKKLHDAKNYLVFKIVDNRFTRRLRDLRRRIAEGETTLSNTFSEYFQRLGDFNTTNTGHRIEPGPFDEITRSEINRAFGYEIIAVPDRGNEPEANRPRVNHSGDPETGSGPSYNPPPNTQNSTDPNQNGHTDAFRFDMEGEDEVRV